MSWQPWSDVNRCAMNPESDLFTFYETAEDINSCQRKANYTVHTYHIEHNCCSASPQNNEKDF